MKKETIYLLAIFYQTKIERKDFSVSDARYFRDAFKDIVEMALTIEKDKQVVLKLENKEEELKKLFEEKYDGVTLSIDLNSLEKAGIKMTISELELLEKAVSNPSQEAVKEEVEK